MIPRSIPYTQRIIVPGKTIEDVYDTVNLWLSKNRCSVTKQAPPTLIEARYSAKIPILHVGPKDNNPKSIEVRLSPLGEDVLLYFTITQGIDKMGNSGYVFWGVKLRELYEAVGVNVNDSMWSELMPVGILKGEIESKIRLFAVFIIISVILVWYLWGPSRDLAVLYAFLIMIPGGFLAVWDIREHSRLRIIINSS